MSEVPLCGIEDGSHGIAHIGSQDDPLLGYQIEPFVVRCAHVDVQAFRRILEVCGFL